MSTYPGDVWQLAEEQLLEPLGVRGAPRDHRSGRHQPLVGPHPGHVGAVVAGRLSARPPLHVPEPGDRTVRLLVRQLPRLPAEVAAARADRADPRRARRHERPRRVLPALGGLLQGRLHLGRQGRRRAGRGAQGVPPVPGPERHASSRTTRSRASGISTRSRSARIRRRSAHPSPLLEHGNTSPERARSGVIHWGLGIRLWHDPDAPTESKKWADFSKANNTPFDHGWHTHTYFTTYKVRLRNANKWVNLLDKGRMTSLDDPEVRALASRYGDPDYILAEDWIPEVPGHQRARRLHAGLRAEPRQVRARLVKKADEGQLRALLPRQGRGHHRRRPGSKQ